MIQGRYFVAVLTVFSFACIGTAELASGASLNFIAGWMLIVAILSLCAAAAVAVFSLIGDTDRQTGLTKRWF